MPVTLVRAGYTQLPDANQFFEAEAVTTPDGPAERQRTSDPDAHTLLATLSSEATALLALTALQALLAAAPASPASDVTLNAILARLADGTVHTHVDNFPAFPTTQAVTAASLPLPAGAAKDSTLTDSSLRVGGTVAVAGVVSVTGSVAVTGPLTDTQLRATAVPVSGTITVSNPTAVGLTDTQLRASAIPVTITGVATAANQATANASLASLDGKFPDESGVWDYTAGLTGTVTLTGGKRLLGIAASAPTSGSASMQINGGAAITIPAGKSIEFEPRANTTDPTIVFTGTDSYVVEWVI